MLTERASGLKKDCPRTLLFCKTILDCSLLYKPFTRMLQSVSKHINMYHSCTPEAEKASISKDMSECDGEVRLLIGTNAAGMGVYYSAVSRVVNYGPPTELNTLIQQMGRAGHEGLFAHHITFEADMLAYLRDDSVCRRGFDSRTL